MDICIHVPARTETTYAIDITVAPQGEKVRTQRIGFSACNFALPHLELWDSFFPLMWLTRNGGPLYGKSFAHATIRADFPLHAGVADFFSQRAGDFGLDIDIVSKTFSQTYDVRTSGSSVSFGGGKDSRLLLGTLRELGRDPTVVSAEGTTYAKDIEGALCVDTYNSAIANRVLPALMLAPQHLYHGSALGDVHLATPWHQYFDISAAPAVRQTSELLKKLGVDITIHVPQSVLPYNVTQLILARRYPDLFAGQVSVVPHKSTEKNLHIALLKRYHGLPHHDHCTDEMLVDMAHTFVQRSIERPGYFGYRDCREVDYKEMRSILLRLTRDGELSAIGEPLPEHWDEPWIDSIHSYCNLDVEPKLADIYREYARPWLKGPAGLPESLRGYLPPPQANSRWSRLSDSLLGRRISRAGLH